MTDDPRRWRILALLFCVRTGMALQFQLVGALAPLYGEVYGVGLADIGLLIGLYMAPGVVFALPGGRLAGRYGDRALVLAGLALMTLGGALSVLVDGYDAQVAGRLLTGIGGVILNVLMSKMVQDWFAGGEIATAMAVFVNSWPVGIAAGLVLLPAVAALGGLAAALAVTTGAAALGFLAMAALYRDAPGARAAGGAAAWPSGSALGALAAAALVWGLYNVALGVVFGFGPALLAERGLALTAASAATSLTLWVAVASIPLGGWVADRTGRRDLVTAVGMAGFAAGLLAVGAGADAPWVFLALGFFAGLPAGPVMALPAAALAPSTRAAGMGLFFTIYYAAMLAGPVAAGWLSAVRETAAASFTFGAALLGAAALLLGLFRRLTAPAPAPGLAGPSR